MVGDVHIHHSATTLPAHTPLQLPPAPNQFTGREAELAELDGSLHGHDSSAAFIMVISGAGGVGKTALALRWLHGRAADFDGGQLFANLGSQADGVPVSPGEALGRFLRALGIPAEQVPVELAEQVALYRSLTARGRVAVLLDDAVTAAQVRPLIPAAGGLVVVTSRIGLGGLSLDGACRLWLRPLGPDASVELFTRLVGESQASRDPAAVATVARLCDGFPIAVRVAAAQVVLRPSWSVGRLAEELVGGRAPTDLVIEEDRPVQAALDLSYRSLSSDAARMYRLLSLHPTADFELGVATAAINRTRADAERLVEELLGASLLTENPAGRLRFHDLLLVHARNHVVAEEPATEQRSALRRMLDWYLHMASAADDVLTPYRTRSRRDYEYEPTPPGSFADRDDALAWLEDQRPHLVAVIKAASQHGFPTVAWQLADAIWPLLLFHKHYRDWLEIDPVAAAAARACGEDGAAARLVNRLGYALSELGRLAEAETQFREGLLLRRRSSDRRGEAGSLLGLGTCLMRQGRYTEAVTRFSEALAIYQDIGARRSAGRALINLGEARTRLGQDAEAAEYLLEADRLLAQEGDAYNRGRAGLQLGQIELRAGDLSDARARLEAVLEVMRRFESRLGEADALAALGDVAAAERRYTDASALYTGAIDILSDLGVDGEEVRRRLTQVEEHRTD